MNRARLTLLGSQHDALVTHLQSHPDGHERAAAVLFRRICTSVKGLQDSDRLIAVDIIPFPESWIVTSSDSHVQFRMEPLRELFRRCEEEKLVFGFVHNHPTGLPHFSAIDDKNECTLHAAIRNRNGTTVSFVAMLWARDQWHARTRDVATPHAASSVRHTLVLGDQIEVYGCSPSTATHGEVQARQAAAFGEPFVDVLQSLRIAVVGNGGTGSPFATLAARAGVGELVLVDGDLLEISNLNRVRGLSRSDVGAAKANALKTFIDGIGVAVDVAAIPSNIDEDAVAVDALASCDVIVGCTDDFVGREVLNTALYVYAQALVDIGLGGKIDRTSRAQPYLRYHFGRISTVLPETGQCLFCQGVIKEVWIRTQLARRVNPDLSAEEVKERYLEDGATDAPGVGPFTGAAADFALATVFDLIKPFRNFPAEIRRDMFFVDFVGMGIHSHETEGSRDCPYCVQHRYLVAEEQSRLNRPYLGRRDEST